MAAISTNFALAQGPSGGYTARPERSRSVIVAPLRSMESTISPCQGHHVPPEKAPVSLDLQ